MIIYWVIMNYYSDILMWAKVTSVKLLMASSSILINFLTTCLYSSRSRSFNSFLLFSTRSLFKLAMLERACLVIISISSIKYSNWIPPKSFFLTSPSLSISSKATLCHSYKSLGCDDFSLSEIFAASPLPCIISSMFSCSPAIILWLKRAYRSSSWSILWWRISRRTSPISTPNLLNTWSSL